MWRYQERCALKVKTRKYQIVNGLMVLCVCFSAMLATTSIPIYADDESSQLEKVKTLLTDKCFRCHGANGVANKNVFVLDRDRLVANKVVIPGDPNSLLIKMVETGAMPLGGTPLSLAEQTLLKDWVRKGAPDWQPLTQTGATNNTTNQTQLIAETDILNWIDQDLERTQLRTRPFIRYFSLANLYNARVSAAELTNYQQAFSKLINSLSWHREITNPQAIDPYKTILRIDLRDYNWTAATWRALVANYPYGFIAPNAENIVQHCGSELPYMRVDWFVTNASVPPLYTEILHLPKTVSELERLLGVDVAQNIAEERNVVRAALRNSGVSQNNRVVERHVSTFGAYWRSYDFRSNTDAQNIFKDPVDLHPAGGEMIFNLPNGMQAYFLADGQGRRLDIAPVDIVSDRTAPEDPIIINGRSCMACHYGGIKSLKDDLRAVVETQIAATSFDRDKVLALYSEPTDLNRLIEQDQRRFQQAVTQTGGVLSENFQSEPINALARRYRGELSLAQAAADTGLAIPEFQTLLRRNTHLNSLGFGQFLVDNAGFKRDVWEQHFCDLVSELQLGRLIGATNVAKTSNQLNIAAIASTQTSSTNRNVLNLRQQAEVSRLHSTGQRLIIHSMTKFLRTEILEETLRKNDDFKQLGLVLTSDWQNNDLIMELDKPVFTFNFLYRLIDTKSKTVIASGKVVALNGDIAAPQITKLVLAELKKLNE